MIRAALDWLNTTLANIISKPLPGSDREDKEHG